MVVVAKLFDLLKKTKDFENSDNFVSILYFARKTGSRIFSSSTIRYLLRTQYILVLLCTATNSLQAIGHFMALRFSYVW